MLLNSPRSVFAACFISFGLMGCSSIASGPTGELFERRGVSMIVVPENTRETYFNDVGSAERHCRSPSSDVSVTASEGLSLSLPATAGSGVSETGGTGAVALGGRSPSVLIARELMYRACELTSNLDLPFETTMRVYERFLVSIEKIVASQTGSGTAVTVSVPQTNLPAFPSGPKNTGLTSGSNSGVTDSSSFGQSQSQTQGSASQIIESDE